MSEDLKTAFWDRIDDVRAGLLNAGNTRAVPMSPYADPAENAIWFITAQGTDLSQAAESNATASFAVADPKANLYATVDGHISQVDDPEKLDELWNAVAASWFEDGRRDDDIRLIRMTPTTAEVWATTGAAGFVYELVKSRVTEDKPDMGEHGVIRFI
ncbi:pyridoxamine 5'-phosphate oxidase family protein [Puniceibacterium sediminis]|uniref:General stress protein 26 n=1 Tax=Puniceibacterium sediminis TaxID=1608407 RepID=A0A238W8Z9_9RHOB|nr:pyridoxamine 5'-phosphate oxidase family protein [Puniceibacterium sediminis]SNR42693.1 General stress protein 26 [Puniceibacterium sediminis]